MLSELQRREEENRAMEEGRTLPLVEELKKEIQKLQERRQEEEGGGERMKSGECEAVMKQRDTQVSQPQKYKRRRNADGFSRSALCFYFSFRTLETLLLGPTWPPGRKLPEPRGGRGRAASWR